MSLPDDPTPLQTAFYNQPLSAHLSTWDSLWEANNTPWDRAGPSPALHDLLADRAHDHLFASCRPSPPAQGQQRQRQRQQPRKKALVSGCGRGHDVLLLAALGYDAYGIDFSPVAIRGARANAEAVAAADPEEYRPRDPAVGRGAVTWLEGDWFKFDFAAEVGVDKFDLIFDYTFLCALPPSARPAWAARNAALLRPDGGRLVCLEFPRTKPLHLAGPPWGLRSHIYLAHLSRPGRELPYTDAGDVVAQEEDELGDDPVGATADVAGRGLKRLALIVPPRTHSCGVSEDGTVHDRISVWGH
ncbi:uncharacterized protein E0L32_000106 [Thyridium curvatum]|uniref:Thiol methyltransferase n=1 Tax=Thyridium curvatum TaxID=1093900 RepID=A0A507B0K5_9PEZI|nr:uncharacterized protein E0L32_000106 [Thyridium curvatum]TPX15772.1 hypothetical protein E0L32_000106 [Thyridium curvatum]